MFCYSILCYNNSYKRVGCEVKMVNHVFVPNAVYNIVAKNRVFDGARYVRSETLSEGRGDWETFYSVSQERDEFILRRMCLFSEDIVKVENNIVKANGDIVVNVLPREVETPMVKSWVEEVFELAHNNREDFLNGLVGHLGHLSPLNRRIIYLTGKL